MRRPEVGILALAMLGLACAVPTEAPNWDVTWNIPVPDKGALSIGVGSFLPSGVTIIGGSTPTAFSATVGSPPPITRTLGADCSACAAVNGQNAPKPAFGPTSPPPTTVNLAAAANLGSATLAAGSQVVISMTNGFNFDPIRPQNGSATTGTGTITLTVNNGTTTLGTLTILGTTSAIPGNGAVTNFTMPLSGTINGAQPLSVTFTMNSPQGSSVVINTNQVFTVAATPTINISSATVTIPAQNVLPTSTDIDLSGVDSTITQRIVNDNSTRGTMFLTITNPFTVGGSPTLTFKTPAGVTPAVSITKSVTLTPATNATTPSATTQSINFTGIELRQILGKALQAEFKGTTAAGSTVVTPAHKISGTSRMQLNFTMKEQTP
jgi:hypothetical protein